MSSCCVPSARYLAHDWSFYLHGNPRIGQYYSCFTCEDQRAGSVQLLSQGARAECQMCLVTRTFFFHHPLCLKWMNHFFRNSQLQDRQEDRTGRHSSFCEGCLSGGRLTILGSKNGRSLCCVWFCPTKPGLFLWVFVVTSSRAPWE